MSPWAGTVYSSTVTLPGGVHVEVAISVPEHAAYDDQGELGEVAQHALNGLCGQLSRHTMIAVDRPRPEPPDPWDDHPAQPGAHAQAVRGVPPTS